MQLKANTKKVKVTTPIGMLHFPKLFSIDEMHKDFRTTIAFTPEAAAEVRAAFEQCAKDSFDFDEGESVEDLNLACNAKQPKKWDGPDNLMWMKVKSKYRPTVVDSQLKPLVAEDNRAFSEIGTGATARVAFQLVPYQMATGLKGISARLLSVQIIKGREYKGNDFEVEEGGFESTGPDFSSVGDEVSEDAPRNDAASADYDFS